MLKILLKDTYFLLNYLGKYYRFVFQTIHFGKRKGIIAFYFWEDTNKDNALIEYYYLCFMCILSSFLTLEW